MVGTSVSVADLASSLREQLYNLHTLKSDGESEIKTVNLGLARFYGRIDAMYVEAKEIEIEELNTLFGMLNRAGERKAERLKLSYSPHSVVVKSAGRGRGRIELGSGKAGLFSRKRR